MKKVLIPISEDTHSILKKTAGKKGLKFYSYLAQILEKQAKRDDK
ncbi:hypothetical protein NVP1115B_41 [Vibrio phage 1.115.B._10N.222.49.B11]|nr:hypothetical protein NVP1115A_41 [Vibrio phage 1.115.A._10N.222.49.B11]AUR88587.1 hypothetical protein NVP1115B_41 [Vibrio phage 1.115.B._10N.222.49.B11]